MSATTPNTYQKQFISQALRWLPHHIALYWAANMHWNLAVRWLDAYAKKRIINASTLPAFSSAAVHDYGYVANEAALWHGTGRYQHGVGTTVDVLDAILRTKSIRPVNDVYAIMSEGKAMTSTSLTPLRIIARCYADTHGKGIGQADRYGDALTWTSYYYGLFYARMYTRHCFKVRKYYKTWHSLAHDENGHNTWGKKVNKSAKDVWDVFGLGSDIRGNYPILFGIKALEHTVPLGSVFRDCEVRVSGHIPLHEITHIEVPRIEVAKVESLLASHGIELPVVSIELGEYVASTRSLSELLGLA